MCSDVSFTRVFVLQETLQQLVVMSLPDVLVLGRTPLSGASHVQLNDPLSHEYTTLLLHIHRDVQLLNNNQRC